MKRTPVFVLLVLMLAGCAAQPRMEDEAAADDGAVVGGAIATNLEQLNRHVKALPGQNEQEYRQSLAQVFVELTAILPQLARSNPPGAFRQQIEILQRLPERIRTAPDEQRLGPSVATGVRTLFLALSGVQDRQFADDEAVEQILADMQDRLAGVDSTRGPIQRLAVARALGLANAAVQRLADLERQRQIELVPPATQPAAE